MRTSALSHHDCEGHFTHIILSDLRIVIILENKMLITALLFIKFSLYGCRAKCFTLTFRAILTTILVPMHFYCPHFTGERNGALRG